MLKKSVSPSRIIKSFTTYFLCLLAFSAFSQSTAKPKIRVEKMEYASNSSVMESLNGASPNYVFRVILAKDALIAEKMKQSVISAIKSRWDAVVLNSQWKMKDFFTHNNPPILTTKLKKGIPGNWHLFFQVIDNGPYPINNNSSNSTFSQQSLSVNLEHTSYYIQIKAVIFDGDNGSLIFSKEMMVEMQPSLVPDGQVLLRKLPALTDSFLQAFDSAVQNFFSITSQKELKLEITPACLFLDSDKTLAKFQKLNFVSENDSTIELLQLKQKWIVKNTSIQKTKRINNFGNNLFNSSFTLLTGLPTEKIRAMGYLSKFSFIDTNENISYFCEVPFTMERREEREREVSRDDQGGKSYDNYLNGQRSVTRFVDPNQIIYLIRERDTIGSFKIRIGDDVKSKKHFSQSWDGINESTINAIPEDWNNPTSDQNRQSTPFVLEGALNKIPFVIEKSKLGNQIDIEINNQEIMTLKIYNNKPVFGLLHSPVIDKKVFNFLMMLSTLPFNSIL